MILSAINNHYTNRSNNINTIALIIDQVENYDLMNVISKAYNSFDFNSVDHFDEETKRIAKEAKILINDIFTKKIRNKDDAIKYFELMSTLPDDTKEEILGRLGSYSEEVLADYVGTFAGLANLEDLKIAISDLNDSWMNLNTSTLSDIKEDRRDFITKGDNLYRLINRYREESTLNKSDFTVDIHNDDNTFGLADVLYSVEKEDKEKLYTGTWFDNITAGLKAESLYIVCGLSGGGKSFFLQNMAEEISCKMKRSDFECKDGEIPAILYVNLEISPRQLLERKIAFYNGDRDYIFYGNGDDTEEERRTGSAFSRRMTELLKKNGSEIPVLYHSENSTSREYSVGDLKTTIQRYQQRGYKIVGVITDYLDKFKWDRSKGISERERDEPIVLKAYDHKELAKEFRIPVITGAQLNTSAAEAIKDRLDRADKEDVVRNLNEKHIGKARALTNVPEQIYFVHKYSVGEEPFTNHYFALVVDKDRDGTAKYIRRDKHKDVPRYANKKSQDGRVYYITRIPGNDDDNRSTFRIGNDYANSVTVHQFYHGAPTEIYTDLDNPLDNIDMETGELIEKPSNDKPKESKNNNDDIEAKYGKIPDDLE